MRCQLAMTCAVRAMGDSRVDPAHGRSLDVVSPHKAPPPLNQSPQQYSLHIPSQYFHPIPAQTAYYHYLLVSTWQREVYISGLLSASRCPQLHQGLQFNPSPLLSPRGGSALMVERNDGSVMAHEKVSALDGSMKPTGNVILSATALASFD